VLGFVMPRKEDRLDAGCAQRAAAPVAAQRTCAVTGVRRESVPASNIQIRRRRGEGA
jgi:hypothetical protein